MLCPGLSPERGPGCAIQASLRPKASRARNREAYTVAPAPPTVMYVSGGRWRRIQLPMMMRSLDSTA